MDSGTLTLFGGNRKRRRPVEEKPISSSSEPSSSSHSSSTLSSSPITTTTTTNNTHISQKKSSKPNNYSTITTTTTTPPETNLFNSTNIIPSSSINKDPNITFNHLGLNTWLLKAVHAMGINKPTPIQQGTIGPILQGYDIIGLAQTGTGKTAAFALPILQRLSEDPYGIYAVILTPSRELAYQISDQFIAFSVSLGITICTITGGMDMVNQSIQLQKKPHIIVATPGRLAYHIKQSATPPDLSKVAFVVFDECDRLLDDSFAPDIKEILNAIQNNSSSNTRQTLLYSATLTSDMRSKEILQRLGIRYNQLRIFDNSLSSNIINNNDNDDDDNDDDDSDTDKNTNHNTSIINHALLAPLTVPNLRQEYLFVPATVKNAYLLETLLTFGPNDLTVSTTSSSSTSSTKTKKNKKDSKNDTKNLLTGSSALNSSINTEDEQISRARSIIIFTSTCRSAELVCEMCIELGIPTTALHSAMPQAKRLASLAKFKGSIVRVLVATDVASRGLDIPFVDLVINYDVPRTPTDYVHRVGRTARAGRGGYAITIITQYEVNLLQTIEETVLGGKKLTKVSDTHISEEEVLKKLTKVATALHLARSRLADKGFDDLLRVRKARKLEAKAERENQNN